MDARLKEFYQKGLINIDEVARRITSPTMLRELKKMSVLPVEPEVIDEDSEPPEAFHRFKSILGRGKQENPESDTD